MRKQPSKNKTVYSIELCLRIVGVTAAIVVALVILWDFVVTHPMAFCQVAETNCLGDWTSALGGWVGGGAAIMAAIFTVRKLAEQIQDGRIQHNEMMKFQAYETLRLAEQVSSAAGNVLGTVKQVFTEFHDSKIPCDRERLQHYHNAMSSVWRELKVTDLASRRLQLLGNVPPHEARFESALPKCLEGLEDCLTLSENDLSANPSNQSIRYASTYMMIAYTDLQQIAEEAGDFRKRWAHLSA